MVRVGLWGTTALMLGGCQDLNPDFVANGSGSGSDSTTQAVTGPTSDTTNSAETDAPTDSVADSTGAVSGGSTSTSATGSTTGSTDSTGGESTGSGPATAHSCAELLAMAPGTPTGIHVLSDGGDVEYEAFCLMDFEDGGWTLVGRSLDDARDDPFGWESARGLVDSEDDAYSLDAWGRGLEFTQILAAERMPGQSVPSGHAYVINVPADFIADYQNSTILHDSTVTVLGDCDPDPPPTMLRRVGRTGDSDQFFFRDIAGNADFGLRADGWALNMDNCANGAAMNADQGLVYVR